MKIKRYLPSIIIMAFACGLIAQFVWKMIYFPEPIILVIGEIVLIIGLAVIGCLVSLRN